MQALLDTVFDALLKPGWGLLALGLIALLAFAVALLLVKPFIKRVVALTDSKLDDLLLSGKVLRQLAFIVPMAVLWLGMPLIRGVPEFLVKHLDSLSGLLLLLFSVRAINTFLNEVNSLYETRSDAHRRPIKGYLQLVKLVLYIFVLIYAVSWALGRSPLVLMSGLGAVGAVILLIFRDTILSLVASVQIASNDVLRVGDWIEMPSAGANGDVIDIALHTVKIQNWDKTIVAIPTYKFASETFKNWRGMQEHGQRRIKRALHLDQGSVRFLTDCDVERLRSFKLIDEYLAAKADEVKANNAELAESGVAEVNLRRLTNIGTFRAYVQAYLSAHPQISSRNTLMVRQLAPTPQGIPMELYCFASTTVWVEYEMLQSDIFDHLLAILSEFDLRLFQTPTGGDLSEALNPKR